MSFSSMYLRIIIISALISLSRAAADTTGWEIINGDKPWDDRGNTESLLSEEHLLPYKPQQKSDVRTVIGRPKPQEHSKTNALPVKEATKTVRDIKTQEMSHGTQRHLLQLDHEGLVQSQSSIHMRQSVQSPDVKVKLSRACKENDEDDCLYDVEDYVAKAENEDDEGINALDEIIDNDGDDDDGDDDGDDDVNANHVSRHKRQATEGSGTDLLYNPDEEHALKGTYEFSPSTELSVTYNGSNTELTSAEVQMVKEAITASFNSTRASLRL
ncbi:probable WRKY transcription factor protein 1 [Pomacea canaliculata]|uniref:probable WRKY transcription factor protein 1 n=1 Tax=Pomacea canaliculata TaxID=400727 RepID=UPI000D72EB43|nr:probable WRKY transcription factor protein 1 [Pomacea canaliculata]